MDIIEKNRRDFKTDWRRQNDNYSAQMEHFYMSKELADINFVFSRNGVVTVSFFENFVMDLLDVLENPRP